MIDNKVFAFGIIALLMIGGMFAVNFLVINDNGITGATFFDRFRAPTVVNRLNIVCNSDSDCQGGKICRLLSIESNRKYCLNLGLSGDLCFTSDDCARNYRCTYGTVLASCYYTLNDKIGSDTCQRSIDCGAGSICRAKGIVENPYYSCSNDANALGIARSYGLFIPTR